MDENKENITNPTPEAAKPETEGSEMTTEQWTAKMAELIAENKRYKAATDKATAEAASWKKKYAATQTDAERLSMEKAEEEAKKQEELEELRKYKAIAEATETYRGLGYSDELAKSAAEAQFAKDFVELARIQQLYQDDLKKQIKADMMRNMPAPATGNDDSVQVTKEQFKAMSYREQVEFKRNHPTAYEKLAR